LSYKDDFTRSVEPPIGIEVKRKVLEEVPIIEKKEREKNSRGCTVVHFPHDPDDLPPLPLPPAKNRPDYHGWTHSDDADSWYLEAHTPSIHEHYESFYDEALKKKVICPKFYSCV